MYSDSQLLCGIREVWPDITGSDQPFEANTRIDVYMKSDGAWEDVDFADIFHRLEEFFRFSCTNEEWTQFFGYDVARRNLDEWERAVAPKLTFGALAHFIAERVDFVSLRPATIFGRTCRPAGVFLGIQRLANRRRSTSRRFGPSTRIVSELRGQALDEFWIHLRWMTHRSIPVLPLYWRNVTGNAILIGCLAVIAGLVATWLAGKAAFSLVAIAAAFGLYYLASLYKYVVYPLPSEIVTFRDLALLISESGSDAVK